MNIGRLKKVDLHNLWSGESTDFTPWLAKEDNILLLAETVGLDLELIQEEKSVGPFRADLLCKNAIDDTYVLIENQLEKTDHTHLGQIMTYAAGLDAVNIIWIAKKFTEEHRAAIDWLNRVTDEKLRFFGIELEAYRIGDSVPAPLFQLVSKPNDWTKSINKTRQGKLTDAQELYIEYWTAMKNYFENTNTKIRNQKPLPQHWTNFSIGRSYFKLAVSASVRDNYNRVEFIMEGPQASDRFEKLKNKFEEASYKEIDENIVWDKVENKILSWVYIQKKSVISNRDGWPNQFKWILEKLEKMDKFFRPKIKQIN